MQIHIKGQNFVSGELYITSYETSAIGPSTTTEGKMGQALTISHWRTMTC